MSAWQKSPTVSLRSQARGCQVRLAPPIWVLSRCCLLCRAALDQRDQGQGTCVGCVSILALGSPCGMQAPSSGFEEDCLRARGCCAAASSPCPCGKGTCCPACTAVAPLVILLPAVQRTANCKGQRCHSAKAAARHIEEGKTGILVRAARAAAGTCRGIASPPTLRLQPAYQVSLLVLFSTRRLQPLAGVVLQLTPHLSCCCPSILQTGAYDEARQLSGLLIGCILDASPHSLAPSPGTSRHPLCASPDTSLLAGIYGAPRGLLPNISGFGLWDAAPCALAAICQHWDAAHDVAHGAARGAAHGAARGAAHDAARPFDSTQKFHLEDSFSCRCARRSQLPAQGSQEHQGHYSEETQEPAMRIPQFWRLDRCCGYFEVLDQAAQFFSSSLRALMTH